MPPLAPSTWAEVPAAVRRALDYAREKIAEGGMPVLSEVADVAGWKAGPVNAHWGGPRPLTNTLIGAGLGALLGYGGGALAEQFFPEGTFEPGKPRKRLALLGAGLGTLPGLYQAYDNLMGGQGVLDRWPPPAYQAYPEPILARPRPAIPVPAVIPPARDFNKPAADRLPGGLADRKTDADFDPASLDAGQKIELEHTSDRSLAREVARDHLSEDPAYYKKLKTMEAKEALERLEREKTAQNLFAPVINRDRFQAAVFADPFTPPNIAAGAAGLVEAASASRGMPVVTPWDVTRIAVGGGSGLASGYIVGKVFGALAGLTPERQRDLQRAGAWSGVLRAVVPQALGFR